MGNDRHQCGMTTNVESGLRSLANQFNKYSTHRFASQTIWCCIYIGLTLNSTLLVQLLGMRFVWGGLTALYKSIGPLQQVGMIVI